MSDFSNTESEEVAADSEGDVETGAGATVQRYSEESLDTLATSTSSALDDELGIPATQAGGGLAGDAETGAA